MQTEGDTIVTVVLSKEEQKMLSAMGYHDLKTITLRALLRILIEEAYESAWE